RPPGSRRLRCGARTTIHRWRAQSARPTRAPQSAHRPPRLPPAAPPPHTRTRPRAGARSFVATPRVSFAGVRLLPALRSGEEVPSALVGSDVIVAAGNLRLWRRELAVLSGGIAAVRAARLCPVLRVDPVRQRVAGAIDLVAERRRVVHVRQPRRTHVPNPLRGAGLHPPLKLALPRRPRDVRP